MKYTTITEVWPEGSKRMEWNCEDGDEAADHAKTISLLILDPETGFPDGVGGPEGVHHQAYLTHEMRYGGKA